MIKKEKLKICRNTKIECMDDRLQTMITSNTDKEQGLKTF